MESSNRVRFFEDLWIWQQARVLVREVYGDMKSGSGKRDFGLRDQIQRAAISIMNNIAEGFERGTNKEFARFLEIARGSAGEVRSMYYLAEDLKYVSNQTAEERRIMCRRIGGAVSSLASYLRSHDGPRTSGDSDDSAVKELLVPYERFGRHSS